MFYPYKFFSVLLLCFTAVFFGISCNEEIPKLDPTEHPIVARWRINTSFGSRYINGFWQESENGVNNNGTVEFRDNAWGTFDLGFNLLDSSYVFQEEFTWINTDTAVIFNQDWPNQFHWNINSSNANLQSFQFGFFENDSTDVLITLGFSRAE